MKRCFRGSWLLFVAAPAIAAAGQAPPRLDAPQVVCRGEDRVAALDLTTLPGTARVGEPVLLTFQFQAICATAIPWRIEAGGRPVASGTHEAPQVAGATLAVSATWTPKAAGEAPLRGLADPDNALGEAEAARRNNTIARTVIVEPPPQPVRDPPPPAPAPTPTPPPAPDPRGEPGAKGTCTAWERRVSGHGEGLIAVRRARGAPSGFDYAECGRKLVVEVGKAHCTPEDRKSLAKKPWFLQPGDLALVPQSVDCR
jgi:hypothetical protein